VTPFRPQAVETRYAGITFRSRLEARWAVFMDEVDISWTYEPDRVQLPGGGTYLPDFVTGNGAFIEVKGAEENLDKPYLIRAAAVLGHLSILGPIPECRRGAPVRTILVSPSTGDIDAVRLLRAWADYRPVIPAEQSTVRYGYEESMDAQHWLAPGVIEDRACRGGCPYDAARGARFEHGESGAVR
jgi:hypothetical protein